MSAPTRKQSSVGSINVARARCVTNRFVNSNALAQPHTATPMSSISVATR
jgi:hypothetical protein